MPALLERYQLYVPDLAGILGLFDGTLIVIRGMNLDDLFFRIFRARFRLSPTRTCEYTPVPSNTTHRITLRLSFI